MRPRQDDMHKNNANEISAFQKRIMFPALRKIHTVSTY